jgi:GrpB-like predicted nucleotidyltransferase (UPF0157 family)
VSDPLGLPRGTVSILEYDERWPRLFAAEAARLRDVLGERALAVEHVGSTAVPGLPTKPVLDLSVAVESLVVARECVPVLEPLGYEHRVNDGVSDRLFLARGPEDCRTHYLSLTPEGSECRRDHLDFRDYLRADPDRRDVYAALKRDLAVAHPGDRVTYTAAKAAFIRETLALARD